LKEDHIVKIIDLMPVNVADLDVLLQGYPITISKENQAKIVDTIGPFKKLK
jgi:DNA-directed RNA polymerase subunit F